MIQVFKPLRFWKRIQFDCVNKTILYSVPDRVTLKPNIARFKAWKFKKSGGGQR